LRHPLLDLGALLAALCWTLRDARNGIGPVAVVFSSVWMSTMPRCDCFFDIDRLGLIISDAASSSVVASVTAFAVERGFLPAEAEAAGSSFLLLPDRNGESVVACRFSIRVSSAGLDDANLRQLLNADLRACCR